MREYSGAIMKLIAALATTVALLGTGAAFGADAPELVVDEEAIAMATISWDGFYVGIGGAFLSSTTIVETIVAIQGTVGFNQTIDTFLLGVEAYAQADWSSLGTPVYFALGAEVRGGVLATDQVLLYAALGAEYVQGGNTYATLGGGLEFALTEDLSLDLEYKYYVGLNSAWQGHSVSASANWHF